MARVLAFFTFFHLSLTFFDWSKLVVSKMSLTTQERNNFASFRALGNSNWSALS